MPEETTTPARSVDAKKTGDPRLSRRSVLGAAAFTAPALAFVSSAPAYATSADSTLSVSVPWPDVFASTSVTVSVLDAAGRPWAGQTVSLTTTQAGITFDAPTGVTDAAGIFTTTARVAGSVTSYTVVPIRAASGPLVADTAFTAMQAISVEAGPRPVAIALLEARERAYVGNLHSNTLAVIDTRIKNPLPSIPLAGSGVDVVLSPDKSRLFVANNSVTPSVYVLDTATDAVLANIPTPLPMTTLAVSPDANRVYATHGSAVGVRVIDPTSATPAVTALTDRSIASIAPTADGAHLYMTNGTQFLDVDPASFTVRASVDAGLELGRIALDTRSSLAYVAHLNNPNLTVIDTATLSVVTRVPLPGTPWGVAVSPTENRAFVALADRDYVAVIDTQTNTVMTTISAGSGVWDVKLNAEGTLLYAAAQGQGMMAIANVYRM